MIEPSTLQIDGQTGEMTGDMTGKLTGKLTGVSGSYRKWLSETRGTYLDQGACDALLAQGQDRLIYTVAALSQPGQDLLFGTTTIEPGRIGDEYHMTRGHFHANAAMGEIYYTQSGEGLLLLQNRAGEIRTQPMRPGACNHIPPGWAHRSVNLGDGRLVFFYTCNLAAGNEYAEILTRGIGQRVLCRNGRPVIEPWS